MKKATKTICSLITAISVVITPLSASAHNIEKWANYYTAESANNTNCFGIGNVYHINGRVGYYAWDNSTVKGYFETALNQGETSWGGMIDIVENETNACFTVKYNPNTASDTAAYVILHGPCYGHYSAEEIQTEMVMGNILNYTAKQKSQVAAHELGHLWCIEDLYDYDENLQSIYSNTYRFNAPTRHDKNAMYIGQDRPWYTDASGNLKFLEKPGKFSTSEWVYSVGYQPTASIASCYYMNSNGIYVSNANSQYRKPYQSYCVGTTLSAGQTLSENQYLASINKKFIALMQSDGNFAVYNTDSMLWSAETTGQGTGAKSLKVQGDGNIVIYDSSTPGNSLWNLWSQSGTNGRKAVRLVMQEDGNLVAYDSAGAAIWAIGVQTGGIGTFNVVNVAEKNSCVAITDGATDLGTTLNKGQTLSQNQFLSSNNKKFIAIMKSDGNFAIYNTDKMLWSTNTNGKGTGNKSITVQSDGNIVIYDSATPNRSALWAMWNYAGVDRHQAIRLVMQEDGNLVAYSADGKPVWWSKTNGAFGAGTFNIN